MPSNQETDQAYSTAPRPTMGKISANKTPADLSYNSQQTVHLNVHNDYMLYDVTGIKNMTAGIKNMTANYDNPYTFSFRLIFLVHTG